MAETAELVSMRAMGTSIAMIFRDACGEVGLVADADEAVIHALHHHRSLLQGGGGGVPDHGRLLGRVLGAAGAHLSRVLVRPGLRPAFWLRVVGAQRSSELHLDVFDAAVLLLAGRVPVELVPPIAIDWDHGLQELLDDR